MLDIIWTITALGLMLGFGYLWGYCTESRECDKGHDWNTYTWGTGVNIHGARRCNRCNRYEELDVRWKSAYDPKKHRYK